MITVVKRWPFRQRNQQVKNSEIWRGRRVKKSIYQCGETDTESHSQTGAFLLEFLFISWVINDSGPSLGRRRPWASVGMLQLRGCKYLAVFTEAFTPDLLLDSDDLNAFCFCPLHGNSLRKLDPSCVVTWLAECSPRYVSLPDSSDDFPTASVTNGLCVCVCLWWWCIFFFKWPCLLMASHRTVVFLNVHQLHDYLWVKINYSYLIRVPTTPLHNSPL